MKTRHIKTWLHSLSLEVDSCHVSLEIILSFLEMKYTNVRRKPPGGWYWLLYNMNIWKIDWVQTQMEVTSRCLTKHLHSSHLWNCHMSSRDFLPDDLGIRLISRRNGRVMQERPQRMITVRSLGTLLDMCCIKSILHTYYIDIWYVMYRWCTYVLRCILVWFVLPA